MYPLVTVSITAYNSGHTIIETLESIKNQSYTNIELLITDDASSDNTVEVSENWINNNRNCFVRAEVIPSKINTGVSANANRGLQKAKGEWIKYLGADDTLKPDCIENNICWIQENQEIKVLFSRLEIYNNTFEQGNLVDVTPGIPYPKSGLLSEEKDPATQYNMLLVSDRIHFSPSVFIHTPTLLNVGGFDERFRVLEDYPLWLTLTKNGVKLHFMDKVTVNYRRHAKAINNTGMSFLINPNYFRAEYFRKLYTYPNLPWDICLNQKYYWICAQLFRPNWVNKNSRFNRNLLALLTFYLNPLTYLIWSRKKMVKKIRNSELYN